MNPDRPGPPRESGAAEDEGAPLRAFVDGLDAYAASLSAHEQRLLRVLLYRAMTPMERLRLQGVSSGLLTAEEEEFLQELDRAPGQGG